MKDVGLVDQFHALRHALSLALSQALRPSHGVRREAPAGQLQGLDDAEARRIGRLRAAWGVDFAATLASVTARNSYAYLGALDEAARRWACDFPAGAVVVDLGSANFWYAQALQAFFKPSRLVGVELDGYRRYRDGHSRIDYAAGYVAEVPGAEYLVADCTALELPSDVITAWFPFVTPGPLLAWRLPLSAWRPAAFFAGVRRNLRPGGRFVMVNRAGEKDTAAALATAAGLSPAGGTALELVLVEETLDVVLTLWSA